MPFLAALQLVLFILWFVPPVAAVVPAFVFFLPGLIWLTVFGGIIVLVVVGAFAKAALQRA